MTKLQEHLYRYMEEQTHLDSLYLRHIFLETLNLLPSLLHAPL